MSRASCPFGAGLNRTLQSVRTWWYGSLSDYGRCVFGSGTNPTYGLPASPTKRLPESLYSGAMACRGLVVRSRKTSAPWLLAECELVECLMIRLAEIDHVVLRVIDLQAMQRFYCDVLGCREERRQDEIGLIQLRAGASLIDLVAIDSKLGRLGGAAPGLQGHNMDHLCLRVEAYDEAAILAHLKLHNVRVGELGVRYGAKGHGPSIYLHDPQGNMLELKGPPLAD